MEIPGVDFSNDSISVGDVSVTTAEDGSIVVTAGDLSASTGPTGDTSGTVPIPASITAGGTTVSTELVNGQTVITVHVPLDGELLSCQLDLAEGATLEEFLAAVESGEILGIGTPDVDPTDPLGSLFIDTDIGT